jgi:hypothetical protein
MLLMGIKSGRGRVRLLSMLIFTMSSCQYLVSPAFIINLIFQEDPPYPHHSSRGSRDFLNFQSTSLS